MKHKANRLLSLIFALILMVGFLPVPVFATENNYTDYDLCEMVKMYYKETYGTAPPYVGVDSKEGNTVCIVYGEFVPGKLTAWGRYDVDRTTGKAVDPTFNYSVDLSGYYPAVSAPNLYEAYLKVLEKNRDSIFAYDWQNYDSNYRRLGSTPIAVVDILGDEVPELLFIAATQKSAYDNQYWGAELFAYTYENGSAHQVFSRIIDSEVGGMSNYCVFQSGKNNDLWILSAFYNDRSDIEYTRYIFDKNNGTFSPVETYESSAYPDVEYINTYGQLSYITSWKHNETEITESEYESAIMDLDKMTASLILKKYTSDSFAPEEPISAYPHDYIAMTYDEAIAYLNANRDISIPFNGYTALFSNSLFAEPSWKSNSDLALLSGILSWSVYHDEDKPTIKEVYSMLGIPEKDIFDNSDERDKDLRFSIAKKTMYIDGEKTNLLIVVARGTVNEALRDHYTKANSRFLGYNAYDLIYEFQEDIREELVNFCNTHEDLENTPLKVLVTGHSLGGAAANLVAANFTNYADRDSWWSEVADKDDIFCYTFGAIDSIDTDGTVSVGFENIHNIYNLSDNFGKYGWVFFTAAGNSIYGKFGHMDFFNDDRDQGSLTTIQNHDMGTYLDAVIADNSSENRVYYEIATVQKLISVHGPVDIAVYRGSDLVGQIVNNEVVGSVTQIPMSVIENAKYALLPDAEEYRIEITATDSGTMTFSCKYAATGNDAKTFSDVALEAGKTMTSTVGGELETRDVKLYVVDDKGTPVAEVQEDGTEIAVKQNSNLVPLIIGIGAIVLIGLAILFLRKRQNRNENRQ